MRPLLCLLLLTIMVVAGHAQAVDSLIAYPDHTPAQDSGKVKKWREERLFFQEDWDGTGRGIFKHPAAGFSTHIGFRESSVRIVGRDSLLLKFRTRENWSTTGIQLGRCNASELPAGIVAVRKKSGAFSEIKGQPGEAGWLWEIIISWPWDTAFRDRIKPFSFYITLQRE